MIEFEEDPDPRERKASPEVVNRSRRGGTVYPAIRSMFEDLSDHQWNEEYLWKCHTGALVILCLLLGTSTRGTIEAIITRLLAARAVHQKLAPFALGQHDEVAARFNRQEIRWMAKEARLPRSLNKRTMAYILLAWKAATRMAGQDYLERIRTRTTKEWVNPRKRIAPLIHRIFAMANRRTNISPEQTNQNCTERVPSNQTLTE